MDKRGELGRVPDQEDFLGLCISYEANTLASDRTYRIEKGPVKVPLGFLASRIEELCISVIANRKVLVGNFERPKGAYPFCMDVSVPEPVLHQVSVHLRD